MKKPHLFETVARAVILLVQLVAFAPHAQAAAGEVDLSFDPGSGLDGSVGALALQPDGKILIAGNFTQVRGLARPGLARLNPDGSGDSSFDPATGGFALVLQPDGKVLVGGARLHADGSLDTTFTLPLITGYDSISQSAAMALQPDGRILIYGGFRAVGTTLRSGIARLNADGSLDESFLPDTSDNFYARVDAVTLQPDGKILIGGQSMTVDNASIARLNPDGSRDVSFNAGPDDFVSAVTLQPDGKVLIGGLFQSVNGVARGGFARLEANGALDPEFVPGAGTSGWTIAIAVQPDGKIITGRFSTGASGSKLARLYPDGSLDSAFGNLPGIQPSIYALAIQSDGKVLACGIDIAGDSNLVSLNTLVRLNTDGSRDGTFVVLGGVGGKVYSLAVQPDGKVLIGGNFPNIYRTRGVTVARLDPDGGLDGTFQPALGIPADGERILLQPDGRMLLSGRSQSVDSEGTVTGRGEITRLHSDGSLNHSFHAGAGVPGGFDLMALQPDGRILACGESTVDDVRYKTLARLNADGSVDGTFQPLAMEVRNLPDINCVAAQADGKVLVGGRFSIGDDPGSYSLVRLNADGSLDGGFRHGYSEEFVGIEVRCVIPRGDGRILIAGALTGTDGVVAETVQWLNADGSVDASFDTGPGVSIYTATTDGGGIAWQPDGKVIASGYYRPETEEYYSGPVRLNIDGSLDRGFSFETGYFPGNHCLELQADGNVLVGGKFLTIRGVLRPHVARLSGDPRPPVAYAAWVAGFGLSGAAAAANADPDGDGILNAVEYVLGSQPVGFEEVAGSPRPAVRVAGNDMMFTFRRDDASETPEVTVTVESGTNLIAWPDVFVIGANTAASSPGVTVAENGSAPDTITVAIPVGTTQALFARLKVTITP